MTRDVIPNANQSQTFYFRFVEEAVESGESEQIKDFDGKESAGVNVIEDWDDKNAAGTTSIDNKDGPKVTYIDEPKEAVTYGRN